MATDLIRTSAVHGSFPHRSMTVSKSTSVTGWRCGPMTIASFRTRVWRRVAGQHEHDDTSIRKIIGEQRIARPSTCLAKRGLGPIAVPGESWQLWSVDWRLTSTFGTPPKMWPRRVVEQSSMVSATPPHRAGTDLAPSPILVEESE